MTDAPWLDDASSLVDAFRAGERSPKEELQATFDAADQISLQQQMDKLLWEDAYGVTLFQFPGLTFWDENVVTNVSGNTFVPYYFWNFWEWEPVGVEEETE